ncbi:MAG: hypothetical protein K2H19_03180 [Ruminococcus sp.]|nr:hypothetical protein [Ruminococcus sp.]
MKLTKKKEKEFLEKITKIKDLEQKKKEVSKDIDGLKDEIKAYMDRNKTSELIVDVYTVHYTDAVSERFDSKALKKADEELYNKYLKSSAIKRFSIT